MNLLFGHIFVMDILSLVSQRVLEEKKGDLNQLNKIFKGLEEVDLKMTIGSRM